MTRRRTSCRYDLWRSGLGTRHLVGRFEFEPGVRHWSCKDIGEIDRPADAAQRRDALCRLATAGSSRMSWRLGSRRGSRNQCRQRLTARSSYRTPSFVPEPGVRQSRGPGRGRLERMRPTAARPAGAPLSFETKAHLRSSPRNRGSRQASSSRCSDDEVDPSRRACHCDRAPRAREFGRQSRGRTPTASKVKRHGKQPSDPCRAVTVPLETRSRTSSTSGDPCERRPADSRRCHDGVRIPTAVVCRTADRSSCCSNLVQASP